MKVASCRVLEINRGPRDNINLTILQNIVSGSMRDHCGRWGPYLRTHLQDVRPVQRDRPKLLPEDLLAVRTCERLLSAPPKSSRTDTKLLDTHLNMNSQGRRCLDIEYEKSKLGATILTVGACPASKERRTRSRSSHRTRAVIVTVTAVVAVAPVSFSNILHALHAQLQHRAHAEAIS